MRIFAIAALVLLTACACRTPTHYECFPEMAWSKTQQAQLLAELQKYPDNDILWRAEVDREDMRVWGKDKACEG